MISEKKIESYREIIQNIINKYFPKEKRFSVKNYSQEGLYDLASLLLEKDEKKREKIWEDIDRKRKIAIEKFKKAEYNFLQEDIEIHKKKEEYDNLFNTIDELNGLNKNIDLDISFEKEINNI